MKRKLLIAPLWFNLIVAAVLGLLTSPIVFVRMPVWLLLGALGIVAVVANICAEILWRRAHHEVTP